MEQAPWAVYERISYARKPDGTIDTLGVERQEPPCRELVARKGGQVAKVFVDNDRSAFKGRRPDFEEMLAWAARGGSGGLRCGTVTGCPATLTVTTSASSSLRSGSAWSLPRCAASMTCPPPRGG